MAETIAEVNYDDEERLQRFIEHGQNASYHYADDSGKEWNLGHAEKDKALAIYDSCPRQQPEFRKAATKFLWSLNSYRKGGGE